MLVAIMLACVLIINVIMLTNILLCTIRPIKYCFVTYITQKRGSYPIYHDTVLDMNPVDWIIQKNSEDRNIYYRIVWVEYNKKYKYMFSLQGKNQIEE